MVAAVNLVLTLDIFLLTLFKPSLIVLLFMFSQNDLRTLPSCTTLAGNRFEAEDIIVEFVKVHHGKGTCTRVRGKPVASSSILSTRSWDGLQLGLC